MLQTEDLSKRSVVWKRSKVSDFSVVIKVIILNMFRIYIQNMFKMIILNMFYLSIVYKMQNTLRCHYFTMISAL